MGRDLTPIQSFDPTLNRLQTSWREVLNPALAQLAQLVTNPCGIVSAIHRLESSAGFTPGLSVGADVLVARPGFSGRARRLSMVATLGNVGYGPADASFALTVNGAVVPTSRWQVTGELDNGTLTQSAQFDAPFTASDTLSVRCVALPTAFGLGTGTFSVHWY